MGAAFVTPRQALVDSVTVAFVGDDEDAGLGSSKCARCEGQEQAGRERGEGSHDAPMSEGTAFIWIDPIR